MATDNISGSFHPYPTPPSSLPRDMPRNLGSERSITVLASSRAVIGGILAPATIVISQATGKVTSVSRSIRPASDFPPGTSYTDYTPHIILPGLVDAHVHLNEPGRTEWEGFYTGTQAAAFGGVTTVVDMPLNAIPPTTTVANFKEKIAAAQGKCWVDVGFYGGIIPGNAHELKGLVKAGVRGFKGFLIDSGVEEFPAVSSKDIAKVFAELASEPTTVMFHAEMIPPITDSVGDDVQISLPPLMPHGPLDAYSTFLTSRPPAFETYAIEEILSLAHLAPNLPLHIVHLSAMQAIPLLREARAHGVNITAETCPHYLALSAEDIAHGDTRHKCCPPIRESANQDALWTELLAHTGDGVIKTVVSDHSPCTPNLKLLPAHVPGHMHSASSSSSASTSSSPTSTTASDQKTGDFFAAWGGISSVGLTLPIIWTELSRRLGPALNDNGSAAFARALVDVVTWTSVATAAQVGLERRKGDLREGFDADVCVFDPARAWTVDRAAGGMWWRNKCSPWEGKSFVGAVMATWVRGREVFRREGEALAGMRFFGDDGGKGGLVGRCLLEPRES